jgi:hypothetical protein
MQLLLERGDAGYRSLDRRPRVLYELRVLRIRPPRCVSVLILSGVLTNNLRCFFRVTPVPQLQAALVRNPSLLPQPVPHKPAAVLADGAKGAGKGKGKGQVKGKGKDKGGAADKAATASKEEAAGAAASAPSYVPLFSAVPATALPPPPAPTPSKAAAASASALAGVADDSLSNGQGRGLSITTGSDKAVLSLAAGAHTGNSAFKASLSSQQAPSVTVTGTPSSSITAAAGRGGGVSFLSASEAAAAAEQEAASAAAPLFLLPGPIPLIRQVGSHPHFESTTLH